MKLINQRLLLAGAVLAAMSIPAFAQEPACPEGESLYRQDVDNAVGWNQVLPVEEGNAATVRFFGMMEMERTINGDSTIYDTISGGTGIRSRAALNKDRATDETLTYTFYDLPEGQGVYDHFLIVDGDLYWPVCL
ncbi:hypothetical protein [Devosia naphthalenivorans]|uniref:hypothetical protein n=1 Tax=Devosia naphthalenivorans TaxID=2082392 RepID=UPI000D36D27B|nr:hypothetical protein [Devosia naphthalenivorans]